MIFILQVLRPVPFHQKLHSRQRRFQVNTRNSINSARDRDRWRLSSTSCTSTSTLASKAAFAAVDNLDETQSNTISESHVNFLTSFSGRPQQGPPPFIVSRTGHRAPTPHPPRPTAAVDNQHLIQHQIPLPIAKPYLGTRHSSPAPEFMYQRDFQHSSPHSHMSTSTIINKITTSTVSTSHSAPTLASIRAFHPFLPSPLSPNVIIPNTKSNRNPKLNKDNKEKT
jgi:hypothetical protein